MCSRLNCRFVHLTEDDKVEVCDQRVAVCRDHANGQCRRKLCKYYHIPVVLPPANIMATIFNQQSVQQPTQHQKQLPTTSTITSIEQQEQQQQLSITTNNTRANPPINTSLNNHNNNNNLVNNFNNNNILYNNNSIENKVNSLTSQQQQYYTNPSSISPSLTIHTTPAATSPMTLVNASTTSNFTAPTTSTSTIPTPTATPNLSAAALATAYNPTFQHLLKTHPILAPSLAYYELASSGINDFSTNCLPLLPPNSSYAAAPILYPTPTSLAAQQHRQPQQHPQLTSNGRGASGLIKNIQLGTAIGQQQVASNIANRSAIITTST